MKIIEKFKDKINGVLTAFDRMIIKGHIMQLFSDSGKRYFLSQENILLKDFGEYAEKVTKALKENVEKIAQESGRPLIYLNSSRTSKEGTAQDVLKRDPVEEGLICVLSTLEMGPSIEIKKNKETQKLELKNSQRKCLHYYFYYQDKEFGFTTLQHFNTSVPDTNLSTYFVSSGQELKGLRIIALCKIALVPDTNLSDTNLSTY